MRKWLVYLACMMLICTCIPAMAESFDPETLVGRAYSYDEVVEAFGFTVHWTMEFDSSDTLTLTSPNDMLGDSVYNCSWKIEDGNIVTKILENVQGMEPMAPWFDANDEWRAVWSLNDDGTVIPIMPAAAPEASADTDAPVNALTNIAYASQSPSQVLDIHLPEGDGPFPVIMVIHGGGFAFGDQSMPIIQPILSAATARGYAAVSVDYRKSREAIFPAAVADVKAAVRWVRANAETYGFDAEHIAVWGESAGAYLSLMTALTPEVAVLDGDVTDAADYSSAVTALVSFYAPVDFAAMEADAVALGNTFGGDFERRFVGVDSLADDAVAATCWTTYIDQLPQDFILEAWVQVGDAHDTNVPCTQSVAFAAHLADVIGEDHVTFRQIAGAGHEDAVFYTDENLAAILTMLDTVMK